jgi:hypothetical protein
MAVEAKAPENLTVDVARRQVIDGRASSGTELKYQWTLLDGAGATLTGTSLSVATFAASVPGEYVVRLTVTDSSDESSSALTIVSARSRDFRIEGPDSTTSGESVTLSIDPAEVDGLTIEWTCHAVAGNQPIIFLPDQETKTEVTLVPNGPSRLAITATLASDSHQSEVVARARHFLTVTDRISTGENPSDVEWWRDQLIADTRGAYTAAKAAATSWQGYTATALGLFSTIAILAGPEAIDKTDSQLASWAAVAAMVVGFGLAFGGLILLAGINASAPRLGDGLSPTEYEAETLAAAKTAGERLRLSKVLTILGALTLAIGSFSVLVAAAISARQSEPSYVIVRTPSQTYCAELEVSDAGELQVGGKAIGETVAVTVVDDCGTD